MNPKPDANDTPLAMDAPDAAAHASDTQPYADDNPFVPPAFERIDGLQWTAVHTKPRCEKLLARYCLHYAIPCYLPLRRRVQRYQRRRVVTLLPMFTGYVFVQLHPEQHGIVYQSHKAVRILPVDEPREVRLLADLRNVRRLEIIGRDRPVEVMPQIVPGRLVRIRTGPLRGVEGVVQFLHGKARVVVNVEMLGHAAAVDLDVTEVDPDG